MGLQLSVAWQQCFLTPTAALILISCNCTGADDSDSGKTEFEKKMADPAWVAEVAAAWRAKMLSPNVINDEVEMAIDHWTPSLERN
ncbi:MULTISPECIES: hypothetical protein [unclassified Paraburkholderia]|uniref:hypothetical protein n=1 Tax=unclassified Paraburkholderia TaxID=2615204 RepID=UPI001612F375|nr:MULTISPECIES: hypothetical protein [unclassified Paraburkholderia]MBB5441436.1 hypothetical protein [Paraburkholderia sp. WSM4177]MBB5481831.1 hypothetical protein [Paraburkholderia sp. WSM4180]